MTSANPSSGAEPSSPYRRRIIFTGVAGVAALALARWLQPAPGPGAAPTALSTDGAEIMRALLPALLEGALPRAMRERDAAIDDTIEGVAVAIGALPPIAQQELRALFTLLALAPV